MIKTPEIINQTLEVFSQKFGVKTEFLWEEMIHQQSIEAKIDLVIGIIASIFFIVGFILLIIGLVKFEPSIAAFATFLCILTLLIAGIYFHDSYMEFKNPEYQVIKEFLNTFRDVR